MCKNNFVVSIIQHSSQNDESQLVNARKQIKPVMHQMARFRQCFDCAINPFYFIYDV